MKIYVAIAFLHGDMSIPVPVASTWSRDEMPLRLHEFEERLISSGESLDDYRVVEFEVHEPKYQGHTNWETWAFFTYFFDVIDDAVARAASQFERGGFKDRDEAVEFVVKELQQALQDMAGDVGDCLLGDLFMRDLAERFVWRVDWDSVREYVKENLKHMEEKP